VNEPLSTDGATQSGREASRKHRHIVWLGVLAGAALAVIGARFMVLPGPATWSFGLGKGPFGAELQTIIGLRDLWLGGLGIAFAALREWRALALWLGLGALVCVADAALVWNATGKWWAIGFHLGAAVFCGWLGIAAARASRRDGAPDELLDPPTD